MSKYKILITYIFLFVFALKVHAQDPKVTDSGRTVTIRVLDENGVAYGVKSADNKMRVSAMPYLYDLSEGNIADHNVLDKFGRDAAITNSNDDEIWDGSAAYVYLTTADSMFISSSQGADNQVIIVQGLDANWVAQTDSATLSGQSQVRVGATGTEWIRVFRAWINSTSAATGDVYIAQTGALTGGIPNTASEIKAKIMKEDQQTLMAIWSVPAGQTAFIVSWYVSTSAKKTVIFEIKTREFGKVFRTKRTIDIQENSFPQTMEMPLSVSGKSDIVVTALAGTSGGFVSAGFTLWYE